MVNLRTNFAKEISTLIRDTYGSKLKVYDADIPRSVRAAEISAEGVSIFKHDPGGKVAEAYRSVLKTLHKLIDAVRDIPAKVVNREKQREQSR